MEIEEETIVFTKMSCLGCKEKEGISGNIISSLLTHLSFVCVHLCLGSLGINMELRLNTKLLFPAHFFICVLCKVHTSYLDAPFQFLISKQTYFSGKGWNGREYVTVNLNFVLKGWNNFWAGRMEISLSCVLSFTTTLTLSRLL